jgi:hypothetical protein
MAQYGFGSGSLWAVPTYTLAGVAETIPNPVPFGGLQEGSIEFSGNVKELYGQYAFPLITLPGHRKITGKSKFGQISARAVNLFFGETAATGEIKTVNGESGTVPTTPFKITVTNGATWTTDLGVIFALTGLPLKRVVTPAATGEYSVAAGGVYTFDTSDAAKAMYISYAYTAAALPGQLITINNNLLGLANFFKVVLSAIVQGRHMTITLNKCISNKLTFGTKTEDYVIPEFDFAAMADDGGVVGTFSLYSV